MQFLFDFLFPPRADEKAVREISPEGFFALVAPRLVPTTRPACAALLPFSDPRVRSALHEAKYHGSERAFFLLAEALADYLRDMDGGFTKSCIVVPVPLGAVRMRARGFNQVEEVAKRAIRALPKGNQTSLFMLDATVLERVRETPSQVSLPRAEREGNMRGAFAATRRADPSSVYLILDDVLTTGATLQAAIDALAAAGAEYIVPIALAH